MGGLPYGVTEADFFGGCSVPRNKEIMRVFRDLEIVEHLGSGVPRIVNAYGKEAFEIRDSYIRIIFRFAETMAPEVEARAGAQVGTKPGPSWDQVEILRNCMKEQAIVDLMVMARRTNRTKFRNQVIKPLLDQGWLEMTILDKPTSSKQKYRLTRRGLVMLENLSEGQSGG